MKRLVATNTSLEGLDSESNTKFDDHPRALPVWWLIPALAAISASVYPPPSEAERAEVVVARSAIETSAWTSIDSAAAAEFADKHIPSLVIGVVGMEGIVWSRTYGFEDPDKKHPVTIDSTYRVGSIPEVLTNLLVMQLSNAGNLDLDRPVDSYLVDFKPVNPFGGRITLPMLLAHSSGLVQEPPVGSHFATDEPSLAATVRSLNGTTLVAAPGTTTKRSNAGLAVAARVLELVSGQSYSDLVTSRLLQPLGMRMSALTHGSKTPVYAEMAPFDSTRTAAPLFDFGDAPADGLYASARDVAQFVRMLLGHGAVGERRILAPAIFADLGSAATQNAGAVLGLMRGTVGGWQTLESAGSVYGFSSDVLIAPDQQLAVIVLSALDENPSARRLAKFAMTTLAAARAKQPAPVWSQSTVYDTRACNPAGYFRHGAGSLALKIVSGKLYLDAPAVAAEVRRTADGAVLDDAGTFSSALQLSADCNQVVLSGAVYARVIPQEPPPPAAGILQILGDYGWPHDYIRIYERDGLAYARIDGSSYRPLTAAGRDVWAFPRADGPYRLESLRFERDAQGRINGANLGGIVFPRREFGKEAEAALRESMRPIASLRAEALASSPPAEPGPKRAVELVELTPRMPGIRLDVRYATSNNFLKTPVYTQARAFLQCPAAEALRRVASELAPRGFGLTIHDGYRPWFVTKMFWDATPDYNHIFVADPSVGSRHNRGAAVDLTLHDLKTGHIVAMPGDYDEMSSRSFPLYVGGTSLQRWRRDLLSDAMEAQGFRVYEAEWWHFDFDGWQDFPISNLEFSQIGQ